MFVPCAADPHDGLEADLPGEVAAQSPLEGLRLGRVMLRVHPGVVVQAAARKLTDAGCGTDGAGCL